MSRDQSPRKDAGKPDPGNKSVAVELRLRQDAGIRQRFRTSSPIGQSFRVKVGGNKSLPHSMVFMGEARCSDCYRARADLLAAEKSTYGSMYGESRREPLDQKRKNFMQTHPWQVPEVRPGRSHSPNRMLEPHRPTLRRQVFREECL